MNGKLSATLPDVSEVAGQHVILQAMVTQKQEQVRQLQHEETITTANIERLKRDQESLKAQQGIMLQRERDEHGKKLAEETLQLRKVEAELTQRDSNLQQWEKDLKAWEAKIEPIRQAEADIAQARIDIEQLRVTANDTLLRATQLEQSYQQRMAELITREQNVDRTQTEQEVRARDLTQQQEHADVQAAQMALQHDNMLKVREEIDPKLKALSEREKTVSDQVVRAEAFHAEASQKQAENQQLHADLQALAARLKSREDVVLEKELRLTQWEKDLTLRDQSKKSNQSS